MEHPLPKAMACGVTLVWIWALLPTVALAQSASAIDLRALAGQSAPLIADYKYLGVGANPTALFHWLGDKNLSADTTDDAFGRSIPAVTASLTILPVSESQTDTRFKWKVATQESLLFTGIMHGYNLWTEAGTRDALNGHWFQDYLHSVSELRGWSDGDKFMAPYVGHTIEGSVFGFIQRQNEPKYRAVQWGDGRDYFISLLHSLAYSAVWHTLWKIGPISEASIGNVMLHASPGFITLTDTPTLGAVEMIGEDAADRYVIMPLENRTANRMILALARSFLNPGRSFANVMAFQHPWQRENRIGLFGENFRTRQEKNANRCPLAHEGHTKRGSKLPTFLRIQSGKFRINQHIVNMNDFGPEDRPAGYRSATDLGRKRSHVFGIFRRKTMERHIFELSIDQAEHACFVSSAKSRG